MKRLLSVFSAGILEHGGGYVKVPGSAFGKLAGAGETPQPWAEYGLTYGLVSRTLSRMKTTVEIDETRLHRVMKLSGIKTRRGAIEYALREAERAARIRQLLGDALADSEYADSVDPSYDILAVRKREKAGSA
jgi:Arc/MetJ family transcription regulator